MRLPQPVRIRLFLLAVLLLSLGSLLAPADVLAWGRPSTLPGIPDDIRSPKIASEANRLHVVFYRSGSKELYYSRGTTSGDGTASWERPRRIATGVRFGWGIEADNSGTVHVVYGTEDKRIVYIKNPQRGDFGNWSEPELVVEIDNQANEIDIALDNQRTPYVAWGQGVEPSYLYVSYRRGDGSWNVRRASSRAFLYRYAALAVAGGGDSATIHVLTEQKDGNRDPLEISYVSGTRTGTLSQRRFSFAYGISSNLAAQPTLAVDKSTGALYAGFFTGRDIRFDFKFTYSNNNGASWAPLTSDNLGGDLVVTEKSPIVAGNGRAYVMLQVKEVDGGGFASSGFYDTEFSPGSRSFSPPDAIRDVDGTNYKNVTPDYAINQLAKVGVWVADFTRTVAYNSEPGGIADGTPQVPTGAQGLVVEGGQLFSTDQNVTIAVDRPFGSPTRMKVAINGEITASTPSEAYQASFTRPLPAGNFCRPYSIAVQLFNDTGTQSAVLRSSVTVDNAVTALAQVANPREGDRLFTREQNFRLRVQGVGECSGLKTVRSGYAPGNFGAALDIPAQGLDTVLPLQQSSGTSLIYLQVTDVAGNTANYTDSITYDATPPVLAVKGTLTLTVPVQGPNILARLDFEGNRVTDAGFGGRGFWGVQLANSRTLISDTATLSWATLRAEGNEADFALRGWSLLNGIAAADRTPGNYYVYARFVDGAGNPTTGILTSTIRLDTLRLPEVHLPIVANP